MNARFAVNGIQKCSSVEAWTEGFSSFMAGLLGLQAKRSEERVEGLRLDAALATQRDQLEESIIIDDEEAGGKHGFGPFAAAAAARMNGLRGPQNMHATPAAEPAAPARSS